MIENGFRVLIANAALFLVTALLFDILKIRWRPGVMGFQRIFCWTHPQYYRYFVNIKPLEIGSWSYF